MRLKISAIQKMGLEIFNDPQITTLLTGGSAGGPLEIHTPVLTLNGWKEIQELTLQDRVIGRDGKDYGIFTLYPKETKPCYKITFSDKTEVICSSDHLWNVQNLGTGSQTEESERKMRKLTPEQMTRDKEVEEYYPFKNQFGATGETKVKINYYYLTTNYKGEKKKEAKWCLPLHTKPVDFQKENPDIDPYYLGLWLGDGDKGSSYITCSNEDLEFYKTQLEVLKITEDSPGNSRVCFGKELGFRNFENTKKLKQLNVWKNKHLPIEVLTATPDFRLSVLQGLIDSDGNISVDGDICFGNTNKDLIDKTKELVWSLGGVVTESGPYRNSYTYKGEKKIGKPSWDLNIKMPKDLPPSRLPRKLERWKNSHKLNRVRSIKNIEYVGKKECMCIETGAPDSMFTITNYILSHNSKTFLLCMMALMDCRLHPGTTNYVFRRTFESLKDSTQRTLLTEVHPMFGLTENDYTVKDIGKKIVYKNGSSITFMALDFKPGDPDFAKLGSLLVDNGFIDEAGELPMKEIMDAISSRIGRGQYSQSHKIPGKLVLSANPSQNFLRKEFYDPYEALGGGRFQKWEDGHTYVNDEKVTAYKAFLRFGVKDNPFLTPAYIERLRALPTKERRRLLDGDWDYNDDDNSLFTGDCFKKSLTLELPEPEIVEKEVPGVTRNGQPIIEKQKVFNKVIGVDVADSGKDKTVVSLIEKNVLLDIRPLNIDKNSDKPIARMYAEQLISYAQKHGFTPSEARNIGIEDNGVGQALCAMMETMGWRITHCTATSKSRSENYYDLYLDLDNCDLRLYGDMEGYDELKRQLQGHEVNFNSGKPVICSKDKVKSKIGNSPDYADSANWANYMRKKMKTVARSSRFKMARISRI